MSTELIQLNQPLQMQTSISIIESLSLATMTTRINAITQFQQLVHSKLIKNVDYGVIPGCGDKPTLLKPGAEKVAILLGLTSDYEIIEKVEDFEKDFFNFMMKCNLYSNGNLITQGIGSCNSLEKKVSSEWVNEKKLPEGVNKATLESREVDGKYGKYKQYKVEADSASKANTLLKMCKKRALVDAALMVGGLSQLFTQDIEDMTDQVIDVTPTTTKPASKPTNTGAIITEKQSKRMFAIAKGDKDLIDQVVRSFGYASSKDVKHDDYEAICTKIEELVKNPNATVEPQQQSMFDADGIPLPSDDDYNIDGY